MTSQRGNVITAVDPGSIGDEIGLEPGDRLLAINGHLLRDVIDYRFYGADEELWLDIERDGQVHRIQVERDYDETLGLTFDSVLFDDLRQCDNRCPFCFVAQMPRGLRASLYVRDDDYRLSFLSGSFVTLTNLDEDDWARIAEQHLSPLFVSIHATDPVARRACLGNAQAPDIVAQIHRLGTLGVEVHGQVVIVPGLNDGAHLERTINDCAALWPTLQSLALVPVGLTRFHHGAGRTLTADEARAVLSMAMRVRGGLSSTIDTTWLYPADELYLLAREPIPPALFYDAPEQRDNGVGLVRELLDDWAQTRMRLGRRHIAVSSATLVCGTAIAPVLAPLVDELASAIGTRLHLEPIVNRFFGESVTVSGLITAQDVIAQLAPERTGDCIVLPRSMFDADGGRTLDDVTLAQLYDHYGRPVHTADRLSRVMRVLNECP